ncbi:MAG: glycoside hydrolase family 97 protein [Planctomycetaceae bacterium]|nr:glycoside hydrolase family 97 protein [Planctomycetaceae bacterium]
MSRIGLFLPVWGVLLTAVPSMCAGDDQKPDLWPIESPEKSICATVALDDLGSLEGYSPGIRLYYRIDRKSADGDVVVLPYSPLGITRCDQAFVEGLRVVGAEAVRRVDETYTLVHGKKRKCTVRANRQTIAFRNEAGARLEVEFHVADDGVAFRYRFPEQSDKLHTVVSETTGFAVPEGVKAWIQPYQEASQWTPAYEEYFQNGIAAGTTSSTKAGWCLPALFQLPGDSSWLLLAEAGLDGTYCGCRLASEAPGGRYQIRFPDPGEGNGVGPVEPSSTLPWATPWRVVLVGRSLDTIVESTMVTDLCPPCAIEDTSWIKPGRAAWSWWSDHDSPRDYQKQIEFIDLAAEMGWEYYLVDANWTLMDGGDVRQMARYAESKGVGLLLWYNSGGEHNYVTEKPRGTLGHPVVRDFELSLLKQWGIKGIKVDFFQSDKQDRIAQYLDILRDAAKHQLMINFHGCTMPRGWSRTWPNLMSMEAVRGAECYTFASEYPEHARWHNTVLPFTRNVVGPMDYTPCAFSDDQFPHLTTNAHELALSVVFESGWLHLADRVSAYRNLPEGPKRFLRDVPVVWDETRLVAGEPGKLAVLARRQGETWYLAGINGEDQPKNVAPNLAFLESGKYRFELIADGGDARSFGGKTMVVESNSPVRIAVRPFGGFVATIRPAKD